MIFNVSVTALVVREFSSAAAHFLLSYEFSEFSFIITERLSYGRGLLLAPAGLSFMYRSLCVLEHFHTNTCAVVVAARNYLIAKNDQYKYSRYICIFCRSLSMLVSRLIDKSS